MRGVAALAAAAATWIALTGATPQLAAPRVRVHGGAVARSALAGLLGAGATMLVTEIPGLAIAVGLLAVAVPLARDARRAVDDDWSRLREWPDILAFVRAGLASGLSVTDALLESLERASGSYAEVADLLRREALFGSGLEGAIGRIPPERLDSTSHRILMTLATAARSGGPRVGEIVGTLAQSVADDIRLREAHHAALSEQRTTVAVALVAPWVMLVLAVVTNPQASTAFSSASGTAVIGAGLVATLLGWLLATRAARLSAPPEVFG